MDSNLAVLVSFAYDWYDEDADIEYSEAKIARRVRGTWSDVSIATENMDDAYFDYPAWSASIGSHVTAAFVCSDYVDQ